MARGISGRGTVVHKCRSPDGRIVAVKDAWIDVARKYQEHDLLREVHENGKMKGVVELLDHWAVEVVGGADSTDWIRSQHPLPSAFSGPIRRHHRLVLTPFAVPISQFKSRRELLLGLCAVIEAHERLYDAGILHRDISDGNAMFVDTENARGC